MEIEVCLGNPDFNSENKVKSMFPQKTWYHPMVIAIILSGAVWLKPVFISRFLRQSFLYQCKNSTETDFSQDSRKVTGLKIQEMRSQVNQPKIEKLKKGNKFKL